MPQQHKLQKSINKEMTVQEMEDKSDRESSSFFQEDNGNYSSMRLMCFIALLAAIIFGFLTIQLKSENDTGVYITFGFLISAFAPKAVQKFAEEKVSVKKNF